MNAPSLEPDTAALAALHWDSGYARLPAALHAPAKATPIDGPWLVAWSPDAAGLLGLDLDDAAAAALVPFLAGERPLPGSTPVAMAYAGHQFGVWVPRLGDGRALLLGEVVGAGGATWDLHLKGCGPTPFSRGFDGRSVLRSAIRELLASEAMAALGIPTTRALAVVGSRTPVQRERTETAATLLRLAPSHVRVGSFEWAASQGEPALRALADHVLERDLPELAGLPDRHARLLEAAVARTARLVADWAAVGFAHGVLNTDNLSVLGLTIDYGPYGFVEAFDPAFVPNHSDHEGRYALDRQPDVCLWNLVQLARALGPLVPREAAGAALDGYAPAFAARFVERFQRKLGLREWRDEDEALLFDLLAAMARGGADWTAFFRRLADFAPGGANEPLRALFTDPAPFDAWALAYAARLRAEGDDAAARAARIRAASPWVVPRNGALQRAIERAEAGDPAEVRRLLALYRRPFDERPGDEADAAPPRRDAPPIVVSCSS